MFYLIFTLILLCISSPFYLSLAKSISTSDGLLKVYISSHIETKWPAFFVVRSRANKQTIKSNRYDNDIDYELIKEFGYKVTSIRWDFVEKRQYSLKKRSVPDTPPFLQPRNNINNIPTFNPTTKRNDLFNSNKWINESMESTSTACLVRAGFLKEKCIGSTVSKSFDYPGKYKVTLSYLIYIKEKSKAWKKTFIFDIEVNDKSLSDVKPVERREFRNLTSQEWQSFVKALYKVKSLGIYDLLVAVHRNSMFRIYDSAQPDINVSHGSSAFLPWHRLYMRVLERSLLNFGKMDKIGVPYWNWTADYLLKDGFRSSILWTDEYLGPDGDFFTKNVKSGPFCSRKSKLCKGKWKIRDDLDGPYLQRRLGYEYPMLPSPENLQTIQNSKQYDKKPGDKSKQPAFRTALEGLATVAHNSVHMFIGGSMTRRTSPNDPAFFLHHSYVDLIWLNWQKMRRCWQNCYIKNSDKRPAQQWTDKLWPWALEIRDVANDRTSQVGYKYVKFEVKTK